MEVNDTLIQRLATLSRLHVDANSIEAIKKDLQNMLDLVEQIQAIDTTDVEPLIHMTEQINILQPDTTTETLTQKQALLNAPAKDSEYFHVPKVVDKT